MSVSQPALADADRLAIGDEAARFTLQNVFVGSATVNSSNGVAQRIEDVRRLSGKTVAISFWAKATSSTPKIGVSLTQSFGTGGSPSANVRTQVGTTAALSTTWTRYQFTQAIPSASGKTFGSNLNTDWTALELWCSDTSNQFSVGVGQQSGTVQFWGMQVEIGSAVTPLEKRDPQTELSLCERFYQVYASMQFSILATSAGAFTTEALPHRTTMRATPSGTVISPTYTNASALTLSPQSSGATATSFTASASGIASVLATVALSADL